MMGWLARVAVCSVLGITNIVLGQQIGHASDPFQPPKDGTDARAHRTGAGAIVITDTHGNVPPPPTGPHVDLPGKHGNPHPYPVIHHGSAPLSPRTPNNNAAHPRVFKHGTSTHGEHPGSSKSVNRGNRANVHNTQVLPNVDTRLPLQLGDVHVDLPGQHGNTGSTPLVHREGVNPGILLHSNIMHKGMHVDVALQPIDQNHGHAVVVDSSHTAEILPVRPSHVGDVHVDLPGQHGNTGSKPIVHREGINPGMLIERDPRPVINPVDIIHQDNGLHLGLPLGTAPPHPDISSSIYVNNQADAMVLKEAIQPVLRRTGAGTFLHNPGHLPAKLKNTFNGGRLHEVGLASTETMGRPLSALRGGMTLDIPNILTKHRQIPRTHVTKTGFVPRTFDEPVRHEKSFGSIGGRSEDLEMYPASFGSVSGRSTRSGGSVVLLGSSLANSGGASLLTFG